MTHFSIRSQGVALITAIIFVSFMTIIAITGLKKAQVMETLATHTKQDVLSFNQAEAALGQGEFWLMSQTELPEAVSQCQDSSCMVWQSAVFSDVLAFDASEWQSYGQTVIPAKPGWVEISEYVIRYRGFQPYELNPEATSRGEGYHFYEVSARGKSATKHQSIVQSIRVEKYD